MCLETQNKNAAPGLTPVLLDWDTCLDWVPDRDALWAISMPRSQGKSTDAPSRRIAIFSDLLRLRLLHRYGGVWMDADTIALPGAHILGEAAQRFDFTASTFGEHTLMNGVLAARKGSHFIAALNADIDRCLSKAPQNASWGEYGFRLFARSAHLADPARTLILPSGTLNQNSHDSSIDYFGPDGSPPPLSALSLCVSLHNATTPQDARDLDAATLRERATGFAQLYDIAMQPRGFTPSLEDFSALNQSDFALCMVAHREQSNARITAQRDSNAKLKSRLDTSVETARSLKSQLQDARETMRKSLVGLNARGLMTRGEVFEHIHNLHLWHSPESVSGCGSTLRQTETLRAQLPPFLEAHGVTSLLDIPCGDLNWLKETDLNGIAYIGADIVPALIAKLQQNAPPGMTFLTADIVSDPLPKADCVMVRDCFSHLPFADIQAALHNIAASGATYLLATHFTDRDQNTDIAAGGFHALNLCAAPFHLPAPVDMLNEMHPNPKNADKTLALWPVSVLAGSIRPQEATT
jgi:hypothetical protein